MVVGDDQQAVGVGAHLVDAGLRLLGAGPALEAERARDHAYHQRVGIGFLGGPGHHRRGPGTGAAAHAGSHEEQVRVGHGLAQQFHGLGSGRRALRRVAAHAEALGQALADLYAVRGLAAAQVLRVGIHRDELHQADIGVHHAVHGVAAAPADAYHLYHGLAVAEIVVVAYPVFRHKAKPGPRG